MRGRRGIGKLINFFPFLLRMHYQPKIFGVRSPGANPYKPPSALWLWAMNGRERGASRGRSVRWGQEFGENGVIDRDTGWWKHTLGVKSVASAG